MIALALRVQVVIVIDESLTHLLYSNSVAQSLSQVVQKMGQVNEQMNGLSKTNKEVEEVADLWRESFQKSAAKSDSESSLSLSQSRDLNYCVP